MAANCSSQGGGRSRPTFPLTSAIVRRARKSDSKIMKPGERHTRAHRPCRGWRREAQASAETGVRGAGAASPAPTRQGP